MTQDNNQQRDESADALAALAAGGDLQAESDAPRDDGLALAEAAPAPGEPAAVAETSYAQRFRQEYIRYQTQSRLAHAHQYKKIMIPLLLVVGGMLLLICVATAIMVVRYGGKEAAQPSAMVQSAPWFIPCAGLLGAVLLLGAWMFHRDTSKADKK